MIYNWDRHSLYMDFSNCNIGKGQPSDIDFFYLGKNDFLILGEIKNEQGTYNEFQKKLVQKIIDNYEKDGMIIYIVHNEFVEQGAKKVDIANCKVKEYYYKGRWIKPRNDLRVIEVIKKYS